MAVYLARLKNNKSMVGMFSAPTPVDLFWTLDQAGDPHEMEVTRMTECCGIFVDLAKGHDQWKPITTSEDGEPCE